MQCLASSAEGQPGQSCLESIDAHHLVQSGGRYEPRFPLLRSCALALVALNVLSRGRCLSHSSFLHGAASPSNALVPCIAGKELDGAGTSRLAQARTRCCGGPQQQRRSCLTVTAMGTGTRQPSTGGEIVDPPLFYPSIQAVYVFGSACLKHSGWKPTFCTGEL